VPPAILVDNLVKTYRRSGQEIRAVDGLSFDVTPGTIFGLFARFHGSTGAGVRRRADEVLEQFGLAQDAGRKVVDLSGGSRRRVQVAKVFMVDTPVAFLHEFSTGMDPILKRSVMDLLRAEARRGRTIVLTTQVLSEAEALCDDILIVDRGRQIARGDLSTLKLLSEGVYQVTVTFETIPEGLPAELEAQSPLRVHVCVCRCWSRPSSSAPRAGFSSTPSSPS
jgi:ABC-type multidrug transport system ATPase subunit